MTAVGTASKRAARRWGRVLGAVPNARSAVEREAHHLHEVEVAGESPAAPLIAILEVGLFLLPILVALIAIAFVAAHYFG